MRSGHYQPVADVCTGAERLSRRVRISECDSHFATFDWFCLSKSEDMYALADLSGTDDDRRHKYKQAEA